VIRGQKLSGWLRQVEAMGVSLEATALYPIPGETANSIWGCLLVLQGDGGRWPEDPGSNVYCQCIEGRLFIPASSRLYPQLSIAEFDRLFKDRLHFYHPETGWVELPEPVKWREVLVRPEAAMRHISTPAESVFVPSRATAFYKQSLSPEEALEDLALEFPQASASNRPLSFGEKIRLWMLRLLLGRARATSDKVRSKWMERLQANLDELEERNNREVDKLLKLFKKDPIEALKYAIPIDNDGVSRGGNTAVFVLSRLWANFSVLGNLLEGMGGGRGTASPASARLGHNQMNLLNQEYRNTALTLMQNKDYRQAAFVYLRLLKDYHAGAEALEKGGYYSEAASIYIKYLDNKLRAAECYEKGQLYGEAIELYKELDRNERVGDLYLVIGKKKESRPWFEKVVAQHLDHQDYIRASLCLRHKLEEPEQAQGWLLEGWRNDRDAVTCLNAYFSEIRDDRQLDREINMVYSKETTEKNKEKFLQVLKQQVERPGVEQTVRDIAYEIVADRIAADPFISGELQAFNKKDKRLIKDILLYRQQQRK
jgi:tetratricopeptide (TPR) repeat protein